MSKSPSRVPPHCRQDKRNQRSLAPRWTEKPVPVILMMSRPEDPPRGLGFLFPIVRI
jgi:hypothetical protein